ncbi:uncharacterized protein LOC132585885 [Heteronotia binoei]|uniref:uncharacterized protein LOC132585885 n=1 Tax=Heteronotia binoei TaxID=13085 RepID=UPI002931D754|nr:uncharacterized protein LOC132585885 [Heteronotia binoei]
MTCTPGISNVLPTISQQFLCTHRFLVAACELLRQHLHVEGLFRKTGSVTRIKALQSRLEAGESCLHMALPCDVASLVKLFLRSLPEPLLPAELQAPMCQVQQRPEEDRGPLTILLTCLVLPASANTLRYFFGFLKDVAARCSQNKMDSANLAVVFAPTLFPSKPCSKLDGEAEELLKTQAAVVELLISHASEIGMIPQSLLGKVQAAFSDTERERQSPPGPELGKGKEVESRRKRRQRRSVGNIVTEALSRFKSGRALQAAPCPETKQSVHQGNDSPNNSTLRTSFNSKRKASDDDVWTSELSVKKRRSALNSEGSDSSNEELLEQPVEADPLQGLPALLFSNSPSNPGSPRISTAKVQRRRSSSRQRPQRKHSTRTAPSCSPTPFERKDVGRKSLRVFFWGSKDLHPLSPSIKLKEPSGQLLTEKTAAEVLGVPGSQQRWAHLPSRKPKETEERPVGQSSDEDSPPYIDQVVAEPAVKHKNGNGATPNLDGVSRRRQELSLGTAEGLHSDPTEAAPLLRPFRVLRRSLSWPEDLSFRDTTERGKMDCIPDEAAVVPGDRFGLAELEKPGVRVTATGMRQAGVHTVCVTLADSYKAAHPENEPCDIPESLHSSKPALPDNHGTQANNFCHLSKVPQSSLKRFALNFQRTSSQPNEGPNTARPKRKGGRRFGRSLSHESGLPLRAEEEEVGCTAKKKGTSLLPPKSPLQSFKAYGRQIFIAHKHWAMAFVGQRGRKESMSPSPQETEQAAADSQEPLLACRLEGERHSYRRSSKFSSVEPQLVAGQDALDL